MKVRRGGLVKKPHSQIQVVLSNKSDERRKRQNQDLANRNLIIKAFSKGIADKSQRNPRDIWEVNQEGACGFYYYKVLWSL